MKLEEQRLLPMRESVLDEIIKTEAQNIDMFVDDVLSKSSSTNAVTGAAVVFDDDDDDDDNDDDNDGGGGRRRN